MQTYSEFQPTEFDPKGVFLDERQDWLVVPVGRTRDSGPFENSNFETALEMLGGESETVEVHSFNHWGPGWFDIIIVAPDSDAASKAEEIEASLENYPVLDDEDLSEREYNDFLESWDNWACRDFVKFLGREFLNSQAAADRLEDVDSDKLREFYWEHASEPYYTDSSGVTMTFRARDFDRQAVANLLRESRAAKRVPCDKCAAGLVGDEDCRHCDGRGWV